MSEQDEMPGGGNRQEFGEPFDETEQGGLERKSEIHEAETMKGAIRTSRINPVETKGRVNYSEG
jgi:hypothetical protein